MAPIGLESTWSKYGQIIIKPNICIRTRTSVHLIGQSDRSILFISHFIFVCTAYATLRISLLSDLLPLNMYQNKTILGNILLYGTVDLFFDTVLSVFNLFQKYIHESGRFRYLKK